jgi:hypothetical protein
VTLTINGQGYKQPLNVTLDPRVHATQADLDAQVALAQRVMRGLAATTDTFWQVKALASAIAERQNSLASAQNAGDLAATLKTLGEQVHTIAEGTRTDTGVGPINRDLARIYTMIETGDMRPVESAQQSVDESCKQIDKVFLAWLILNAYQPNVATAANSAAAMNLTSINAQLAAQHLAPLPVVTGMSLAPACGK